MVEAIDHNAELWHVRGGAYRTASLLDGNFLALKQNVLANLSRYTLDWTYRKMSRGARAIRALPQVRDQVAS